MTDVTSVTEMTEYDADEFYVRCAPEPEGPHTPDIEQRGSPGPAERPPPGGSC